MARVILVLTAIGVTIYAAIDCLRSTETEISKLPKPLWLLVILLLSIPPIGGIAWLVVGRVRVAAASPVPADSHVVAPDDDPDFLRSLDRLRRQIPPPGRRRPKRQPEESGEEDRPTQS